jgi:hypothetical protein
MFVFFYFKGSMNKTHLKVFVVKKFKPFSRFTDACMQLVYKTDGRGLIFKPCRSAERVRVVSSEVILEGSTYVEGAI